MILKKNNNKESKSINKIKNNKQEKVDIILIDDDSMLLDVYTQILKRKGKAVVTYNNPSRFLNEIFKYDKDIKIFFDNDLNCNIDGIELTKKLHNKGYTKLYLFSGKDFMPSEIPEYLTLILKTDIEKFYACAL